MIPESAIAITEFTEVGELPKGCGLSVAQSPIGSGVTKKDKVSTPQLSEELPSTSPGVSV